MCGLFVAEVAAAGPWEFSAAAEGGVDSFLQRFQITDEIVSDLVEGQRALRDTTEVFTEVRGVGEVALRYQQARNRFMARGRLSVGTDLIRESFLLDLRLRPDGNAHKFDGKLEVEGRQFREDSDFSLSSDVLQATTRMHYRRKMSEQLDLGIKGRGELRVYEAPGDFEFDQTRGDVSATATLTRGFEITLDLEGGGGVRDVPDSTEISFVRAFGSADLMWAPSLAWAANLHAGLERREYEDPTVRSAYYDTLLEPSLTWRINGTWSLRLASAQEWLTYDTPTSVYFDFWLGWAGLELRRTWGSLEVGLEPRWSWLAAAGDAEDRYGQPSVLTRLEWFPSPRLWLSWSEEVGHRDYGEAGAESLGLYSDYTFLRSTLLFSWSLRDDLRMDLFVSDEPESHRNEEDDGRLTLVTASVRFGL